MSKEKVEVSVNSRQSATQVDTAVHTQVRAKSQKMSTASNVASGAETVAEFKTADSDGEHTLADCKAERIVLSRNDSIAFVEMLHADDEPNPRLRAAAERFKKIAKI